MDSYIINTDSLAHHLSVTAEQYDRNAAELRAGMPDCAMQSPTSAERLAQQFDRQAAECRKWALALASAERFTVNGDQIIAHCD